LQCTEGKYRSFDDLIDIVRTYYPDTSEKQLVHELVILKHEGSTHKPWFIHCLDIKKPTFAYYTTQFGPASPGNMSESKYNWPMLLDKIGVTSLDELNNYINKYQQ
jgi:hypothetical protein